MALAVLDASVVIAFLDETDALHEPAKVELGSRTGDELVIGASVYAEVLVGPMRSGRRAMTRLEQFIADFAIRVEPLTADVARRAARLRATTPTLRLPDALSIALADSLGADVILTGDERWPRVSRRVRLIQP